MAVDESKWVMVRLTRQTHKRLVEFARSFGAWASENPERVMPGAEDGMALTVAVAELLRRDACHKARSAAASQRRRKDPPWEADVAPFRGFV